jgi:hypothetical protein
VIFFIAKFAPKKYDFKFQPICRISHEKEMVSNWPLFFGDDGHFGDITKLAIKDKKKRKGKKTTTTTT